MADSQATIPCLVRFGAADMHLPSISAQHAANSQCSCVKMNTRTLLCACSVTPDCSHQDVANTSDHVRQVSYTASFAIKAMPA